MMTKLSVTIAETVSQFLKEKQGLLKKTYFLHLPNAPNAFFWLLHLKYSDVRLT